MSQLFKLDGPYCPTLYVVASSLDQAMQIANNIANNGQYKRVEVLDNYIKEAKP